MKLTARNWAGPLPRGADGAWHTAEGQEVVLQAEAAHPAQAALSGVSLAPTSVKRHGNAIVTEWVIPIHTWAGRSEIDVTDGLTRTTSVLDVCPHPNKLGLDAFREMLDELTAISQDLPWGLSPGSLGAERAHDSPSVVHPAVLTHELPVLLDALVQLRRDPLICTRTTRAVASLRQARHVDGRSLKWLCSHPRSLLTAVSPTAATSNESALVDQRRSIKTAAHPATAHIRFLVERVARLLARSARSLSLLAGRHGSEEREHAAWLARRLTTSSDALLHELTLEPLSLVEPSAASEGAAQAVIDHPVYARVQRVARRLLDPGARVSEDALLQISARRTHELFELLVFFRTVAAMRRLLGESWAWHAPAITRGSALDLLPDDSAFVARHPSGRRIEVCYQPTFNAYRSEGLQAARHSLSGERRPDSVIALFEGEALTRWLVLDAKYRSNRTAIHDGLADLHVYRDALRWHGQRCTAGFIAVPSCESTAHVYTTPEYLRAHQFGAVQASKSQDWSILSAFVHGGSEATSPS